MASGLRSAASFPDARTCWASYSDWASRAGKILRPQPEMYDLRTRQKNMGNPPHKWLCLLSSMSAQRLCGGTPITTMNTPTNSEALPLTNCSASCPQCHAVDGFWPADYVDNGVGMEKCSPAHCEACGWSEPTFDDFLNSLQNAKEHTPPRNED